jgi:hypothetical protein
VTAKTSKTVTQHDYALKQAQERVALAEQGGVRIAWRAVHDVGFGGFGLEGDGAGGIDDQFEKDDVHGGKH